MLLPDLREASRRVLRDPDVTDEELALYANEALLSAANRVFLPDLEAAASVVVPAGAASVILPGDFQKGLFAARTGEGGRVAVLTAPMDVRRMEEARLPAGSIQAVASSGTTLRVWPAPEADTTLLLGYYRRPHRLEKGSGAVAFDAATRQLTAVSEPLFGRFRCGDVLVIEGSVLNDNEYTVVTASAKSCVVAEAVADEAAVAVNVLALEIEAIPEELHRDVLVNGILARAFDTKEDALEGKRNTDRYMSLAEKALKDLKAAVNATGYRARTAASGEIRGVTLC